jgi:aldehyde dehydrogenase (NAD+)
MANNSTADAPLLTFDEPLETRHFINGEFVNSINGATFDTINPTTEEKLATVQSADADDVDAAVAAARAAFAIDGKWRTTNASGRRDLMLKLADLIERNRDYLARLESLDNGKPAAVANSADIHLAIQTIRYYAGWADKIQGKTIPVDGNFFAYTRHEPVGVVGQIIPWNFPILMLAWKWGPALATGCTIVMKTSEKTPLTALAIAKLSAAAGFPAGVINVLSGFGPSAGEPLAKHMDVDKIAFTGSTAVGHLIQQFSGQSNLKRVTLELGGKSPNIIFDDCDIDQAIAASQVGLFLNMGQCCCAGSRVFVQDTIYDEFIRRATEEAEKAKIGDPLHEHTTQGPQVDKLQFDSVMRYIDSGKQSVAEGKARLLTGGNRYGEKGYFIEPTVFADVQDDCKIAREEIFGPVMSILKFSTIEEVIARANDTKYGLAAGIMTRDVGKALRVSSAIRAGTVWVNCYDKFDPAAPFGGFKSSGIGRELGEYGLHNYTEVKVVVTPIDR